MWKKCKNCNGNGSVLVEVKPGKWERQTCSACGGVGQVDTGTI